MFAWLAERMDQGGLQFFHSVIWDKRNPGLGQRYRRQHEMLMVSHIRGGRIRWGADVGPTPNIISIMPDRERVHPNEKPLRLMEQIVATHSQPGDTVLDPFMGSGTTGVAAIKLGRKFIGVELDPAHFETACKRIQAAHDEPRLFAEPAPKPEQLALLDGAA